MGIYRTSELVEVSLSKNEIEEGSKWKPNFHVWLFWFVLVGYELAKEYDMETVHNMMHFSPTSS